MLLYTQEPTMHPANASLTVLLVPAFSLVAASEPTVHATFPVDPVRLVDHAEHTPGLETLTADHEGLRYRFVDEAARDAFRAEPTRYAVRLGGSCARMGPLSGSCRTDIYAVVEGRLYIFASEPCRTTFQTHHARLLEHDDAPIDPTPGSSAAASEILRTAVDRATGGKGFAAFRSYETTFSETTESGGQAWVNDQRTLVTFDPPGIETHNAWNGRDWAHHWSAQAGRIVDPDGTTTTMAPAQSDAMRRQAHRDPLLMLARWERGTAVAAMLEPNDDAHPRVRLHAGGVTLDLTIDRGTGDILASACRDRNSAMMLGALERRYTARAVAGGLRIPTDAEAAFDGVRAPDLDRRGLKAVAHPAEPG
jgi:YHS domain-containing protein